MRQTFILLGSIILIGLFGGCGNDFKCDNKDYAEQSLNLLLFGNAEGKNDKNFSIKNLGFEIGEITLIELNKEKKSSICKAKITNKNVEKAMQVFDAYKKGEGESRNLDEVTTSLMGLGAMSGADGMVAGFTGAEFFKSLKIQEDKMQQQTYLDLLSLGAVALNLHANGLAYRIYDNGNGDLMIESDFAK